MVIFTNSKNNFLYKLSTSSKIKFTAVLILSFCFSNELFAQLQQKQNTNSEIISQESEVVNSISAIHFSCNIYFNNKNIDSLSYFKAIANYDSFDQFRFYDKRRLIFFIDKNVSIELFSAKELNEKYGKRISPYTIKDGESFPEIEFALNETGIKPQIVK